MHSRRDVLQMGAGAATVGGLASLAGCSSVPVVGSYFEEELDYLEWAYDPAELDQESLGLSFQNVESVLEADEVPDEEKDNVRENTTENYGDALSGDDVRSVLSVGQSVVLTGSFDGTDVVDELELAEEDGYGEFDFYVDESEDESADALVATDGDFLLRSDPSRFYDFGPREELELLIDTYNGDADRYADVNGNFERVDDELGSGDFAFLNANTESSAEDAPDDEVVGMGVVAAIDGSEVDGRFVLLYNDESGVDLDEAESDVEDFLGDDGELDDIAQDGRVVTAEYTVPTEEF